jgi:hypothetical protein
VKPEPRLPQRRLLLVHPLQIHPKRAILLILREMQTSIVESNEEEHHEGHEELVSMLPVQPHMKLRGGRTVGETSAPTIHSPEDGSEQ